MFTVMKKDRREEWEAKLSIRDTLDLEGLADIPTDF